MSQSANTNLRKVVIEGLYKFEDVEQDDGWTATMGDDPGYYNLSLNLREDEFMWPGLWRTIQACGFGIPRKLVHGKIEYEQLVPLNVVREHDEVQVVADDQASTPTTIKMSETLLSHTNTHHIPPLDFQIHLDRVAHENHCLSVSFERTTRIPDDNKLHHLPPSLGSYQLFSVEKYSKHLPQNVREAGGVFFPMWQREAMWINFKTSFRKYAVRVFVGRVNAITGKQMQSEKDTKNEDKLQDYLVVPGQNWLDGICVAPGVVRQFVAMPLGSGYTVEGQKTSEEKHGGLQIEVTPQIEHGIRSWAHPQQQQHITHPVNNPLKPSGLSEHFTPRDLGCEVGDVLRSYPTNREVRQPFRIQDLFTPEAEGNGKSQDNASLSVATVTLKAAGGIDYLPRADSKPTRRFQEESRTRSGSSSSSKRALFANRGQGIVSAGLLLTEPAPAPPPAPSPHTPSSAPPPLLRVIDSQFGSAPTKPRHNKGKISSYLGKAGKIINEPEPADTTKTDLVEMTEEQAKNVKTLGLAAGGKLIQDIYKDPFPATTWNHAGARILHVHMIDPESFEKVTHIVPQPPPMAVEDYVKSGGEFYVIEEKVDERLDGGDFDNVKSVSQMDQHVGITTEPEFDPKRPKMCTTCERRLCDCIIRPCNHQFCNVCIKRLEETTNTEQSVQQAGHWKCPTCNEPVSHVAGFAAPMNLPGEERLLRTKVPVRVLKIEDGRMRFSSMQTSRV